MYIYKVSPSCLGKVIYLSHLGIASSTSNFTKLYCNCRRKWAACDPITTLRTPTNSSFTLHEFSQKMLAQAFPADFLWWVGSLQTGEYREGAESETLRNLLKCGTYFWCSWLYLQTIKCNDSHKALIWMEGFPKDEFMKEEFPKKEFPANVFLKSGAKLWTVGPRKSHRCEVMATNENFGAVCSLLYPPGIQQILQLTLVLALWNP